MKEIIIFKLFASSTIYVEPGKMLKKSYEFFAKNSQLPSKDFINNKEKEVVEFIFSHQSFTNSFLTDLQLPLNTVICQQVEKPIFDNKYRGEIDVVFINKDNLEESISIEFKRIPERYLSDGNLIYRTENIYDVVRQIHKNKKIGFHKNYVGLIIIVDGYKKDAPNIFESGSADNTFQKVVNFKGRNELEEEIGIIIIEINQYNSEDIQMNNIIEYGFVKHALPIEQPSELTEKLEKMLNFN